jgi:hypothetical protein
MGLAEELIKQGGWEWRQGQATRPQDTMPDIAMITPEYKPGFAYFLAEVFNRVQGEVFLDNRVIARLLSTAPELLSFLEGVLEYDDWLHDLLDAANNGDYTALEAAKQVNLKWAELVRLGRITHAMATGENQELLHQAVADEQARPRLIVSDEARAKILEFPRRADDVEPELPRGTS